MKIRSLHILKTFPLVLLALLGLLTTVQMGCSMAGSEDAGISEDDLGQGYGYGHKPYGYGHKPYGYGYGHKVK